MLRLYDLAGADPNRRFALIAGGFGLRSRIREYQSRLFAWRFVEKAEIAPSGGKTVPVLVDADRWIADSWTIANYLEDA
jgi:glutathione S-transferase